MRVAFEKLASPQVLDFFRGRKLDQKLLNNLEIKLNSIQALANDAELKQFRDPLVRNWLLKVKDAVFDAEDILDEIQHEISKCQVEAEAEAESQTCTCKVPNFFKSSPAKTGVRKVPAHLGKLEYLQVLMSSFNVGKSREFSIQQLGELNLHGSLSIRQLQNVENPSDALAVDLKNKTHLVELELEWDSDWNPDDSTKERDVIENLQPSKHLEKLRMRNYGGTQFPRWLFNNSSCSVVSLTLKNCKYCLCLPPLGLLPSLKELSIKGLDGIVSINADFFGSSSCSFTSLKSLEFYHMKEWEEWECKGVTGAFPRLQRLSIERCPKLKGHLPEQLCHLNSLKISGCEQLVPSALSAPDIHKLYLGDCGELQIDHGTTLKELTIEGHNVEAALFEEIGRNYSCSNNNIPMHSCYDFLVSLRIKGGCDSLTTFPLDMFTILRELCIWKCPNLRRISQGQAHNHLQTLDIKECPQLESLPEGMHVLLPSLDSLCIDDCPKVEMFPEGGLPSNLKEMGLFGGSYKLISLLKSALGGNHSLERLVIGKVDFECLPEEGVLPHSLVTLWIRECGDLKRLDYKELVGGALLSAFLQVAFEKLASPQVLDFFRGRKLDEKLLNNLEIKLNSIQALADDAELKQFRDPPVRNWLLKVKDALFDAEDLLDEIQHEISKCQVEAEAEAESQTCTCKVPNFFKSSPVGSFNKEIKSRMEQVLEDLENLASQSGYLGLQNASGVGSGFGGAVSLHSESTSLVVEKRTPFVMHDLLNDLAKYVCGDICFRLENDQATNIPKTTRHFSVASDHVTCFDGFRTLYNAERLRTFMSLSEEMSFRNYNRWYCKMSTRELFSKFKFLRVLSLSGYSNLTELPDSVGNLKYLHSLDLSNTGIKKLPESTCSLYNLQILKLNGCKHLKELPSNLHKLTDLHRLELMYTGVRKVPAHLGKLEYLQVLMSSFNVGKSREFSIQQLGELNLHGSLSIRQLQNVENPSDALAVDLKNKTHLVELELEWDSDWNPDDSTKERDVIENLQPSKHLKKLTMRNYRGKQFPSWLLDNSSCNVVSLSLNNCKGCLCLPPLGRLPSLKELYIEGLDGIVSINADFLGSSSCSFTSLESLEFSDMKEWEEWECKGVTGAFPRLRRLSIERCPKLKGHLPEQLCHLNSLKISGISQGQALNHLETLSMRECPQLESLPEGMHVLLPSLDSLWIDDCPKVEMFPEGGLPSNLKSMGLYGGSYKLISLLKSALGGNHSLETLDIGRVDVECLPDEGVLPHSLLTLVIKDCGDLKRLDYKGLCHLSSLKRLILWGCPRLQCLPEEGLPKSISTLGILNCPLLKQRCREPEGEDWPKIAHIEEVFIWK
ncbi:putative disease resistance RPP13-like protein 1 [Glycine soja]